MCTTQPDAQVDAAVRSSVSGLVNNGTPHTAFDVTSLVRNQGLKVRHGVVRQLVHDLFVNQDIYTSDWCRTNQNISGGIQAFVFHPDTFDPMNYDPDAVRDAIANNTAPQAAATVATSAPVATNAKTDKRGRFCIRAEDVKNAQLGIPKTPVLVIVGAGQVTILPDKGMGTGRKYKIDEHFNIRLSPAVVAESGITNFTVTVNPQEIIVS
jgi:hypothetical protein